MPVPVPAGYDLTNPDIFATGVPLEEYAWLRRTAPVFWNAQTAAESSFDDGGLWILSRLADVKAVSCARTGWSSEENTAIPRFDGKTVGYGWMDVTWGDAEILLAVQTESRGHGVGSFILQRLEQEAAERGLHYLYNVVRGTHPQHDEVTAWLEARHFTASEDGKLMRAVVNATTQAQVH